MHLYPGVADRRVVAIEEAEQEAVLTGHQLARDEHRVRVDVAEPFMEGSGRIGGLFWGYPLFGALRTARRNKR